MAHEVVALIAQYGSLRVFDHELVIYFTVRTPLATDVPPGSAVQTAT